MAALLLLTGPQAGRRYEVQGEVIIGRSPSCLISLDDSKVSRRHVSLLIEDDQTRVIELGSRNGTLVNGEKLEGEAVLLAGDRLQVGTSTIVFEPPAKASFSEDGAAGAVSLPVEELLPAVGSLAALYSVSISLLSATSEAMVLRRAAEEAQRSLSADRTAAMLGSTSGLMTAAVVGGDEIEVPRAMAGGALERRECSRRGGVLCVPMTASGGSPFGLLYAERAEPFTDDDMRVLAAIGRITGEGFAAVRGRAIDVSAPETPMLGSSKAHRKVVEKARRAATGQDPVFIFGEPGVGKRHLARFIHSRSERGLGPLVMVDCWRPPGEVEETLLGRRSALGVPPRASALLRADGGVILLRNFEALPRPLARRFVDYVQRRMAPAPEGGEERVDVRLIATGRASLARLKELGEIDTDAVAMLNGTEIEIPSLRERSADVFPLLEYFLAEGARAFRKSSLVLSPNAKRLLMDYSWPGNIEELVGVGQRLALLYSGTEVSALQLPPEIQGGAAPTGNLAELVMRIERDAISEALRVARGKKIRAAEKLGISRPTLDKKIEEYKIVVDKRRT